MTPHLSLIVRAAGAATIDTLRRLDRSCSNSLEILLMTSDERSLAHGIRREVRRLGIPVVASRTGQHDAALENAAVRGCRGAWFAFLDPGVLPAEVYLAQAVDVGWNAHADVVTSWSRWPTLEIRPPSDEVTLERVVARPEYLHPATMTSRDAWQRLGEFDTGLGPGWRQDLWIRLLAEGRPARVVPDAVCEWDPGQPSPGIRDVLTSAGFSPNVARKHQRILWAHAAAVLCGRDQRRDELQAARHVLLARRQTAERRLDHLHTEISTVLGALHPEGGGRTEWSDFARLSAMPFEPAGASIREHYIGQLLDAHREDIRGTVLELSDKDVVARLTTDRVARIDRRTLATCIDPAGGLRLTGMPPHAYDCVVLAGVLESVYDVVAALSDIHRLLKPGGAVLAALISTGPSDPLQPVAFWRFTASAARRAFARVFPPETIEVTSFGNVLSSLSSLYRVPVGYLRAHELQAHDPYFPTLIGVRARS